MLREKMQASFEPANMRFGNYESEDWKRLKPSKFRDRDACINILHQEPRIRFYANREVSFRSAGLIRLAFPDDDLRGVFGGWLLQARYMALG